MIYRLADDTLVTSADFTLPGVHADLLTHAVNEINRHHDNELDVGNVYNDVLSGALRNFVILNGDFTPVGLVLYHVGKAHYDTYIAMHVIGMYIDPQAKQVLPLLIPFLKDVATTLSAEKIVGISSRKGWSRRMKPDKVLQLGVWDGQG